MNHPEKFLIVGGGGREAAFSKRLSPQTELYAVMGHRNVTIAGNVAASGGTYLVADESDPQTVAEFAAGQKIDYAFVNADAPLANGVVDALLAKNIKAVGGTRAATRIEWDKIYSIEAVQAIAPQHTPHFKVIEDAGGIDEAIDEFKQRALEIVVKPQGLTGGKGVKVMPEHLATYAAGAQYIKHLFATRPQERVLLVEKLEGVEFTIMGFSDGDNIVLAPASYDYPFRYNGDTGPGTGGMGCFTGERKQLPFMDDRDLSACRTIMQNLIDHLRENGAVFKGVLNGGFFKTRDGIRFMEFNSRFGDPEGLNILTIMQSSFADLVRKLWHGGLKETDVQFADEASVVKYLVAREYPEVSDKALTFQLDLEKIEDMGVHVFFASCIRRDGHDGYVTLKKSRVAALGAVTGRIEDACAVVNRAIDRHISGELEYRSDIGSAESLQAIKNKLPQ